jgi:hypothetical protein
MKRLEPIDDLRCPLCGRGLKVLRPNDDKRESVAFVYSCRCSFVLPIPRIDDAAVKEAR